MKFTKTYKIDITGISSAKYLLNHFEEYFKETGFVIVNKSDTNLRFRYKYIGWHNNSLASRAGGGSINVLIQGNDLKVELYFANFYIAILVIIVCVLMYFQMVDKIENNIGIIISVMFVWLFGGNFLIRYTALRKVFKNKRDSEESQWCLIKLTIAQKS